MSWLRRGAGVAERPGPTHKQLRHWRFRGCMVKRPYTLEEAEARVAGSKVPLTFYKCRFCEAHHMTSRVGSEIDASVKP